MRLFLFILFMGYSFTHAQNLVPNPSIEFITSCSYQADGWQTPNYQTTDFMGECNGYVPLNPFGYQAAYTGSAYAGIRTFLDNTIWYPYKNYREYLSTQLIQPLKKNKRYNVSFYYSVGDDASITSDELGLYISKTPIGTSDVLTYSPQIANPKGNFLTDATNWNKISGTYIASGEEQYIVIGNFKYDSETSIIAYSTTPTPSANGSTYFYIDEVEIIEDTSFHANPPNSELIIPNLITPNNDGLNDYFLVETNFLLQEFHVRIYNRWGESLYVSEDQHFEWDTQNISDGIYFYIIEYNTTEQVKGWVEVMR